jgi:hypothetical protein
MNRSTGTAISEYLCLRFCRVNLDGHWNGEFWQAAPQNFRPRCAHFHSSRKDNQLPEMRYCRSVEHVYNLHALSCSPPEFRAVCLKASKMYLTYMEVSPDALFRLGREKLVSRPLRLLGPGVASLREPTARQLVLL